MLRFLFLVAAGVTVALLVAAANAVRRPLARFVRALLVGLTAMLGIAALAIGAAGFQSDEWWVVAVAAGMLAVAARLGWSLRRRRLHPAAKGVEHVPLTNAAPHARWRRFESGLDWVSRQQAKRSRARIDAFVAERNSPSLTHEHRALLLSCDNRVPELIDACLERCRNASRSERERYVDETLDRLIQIGTEAEHARREVRQADDQRLQVLHRYFDTVAGGDDEQRNAR
jgi:hypothetical protein